ncbi:hypothetical protein [Burkholderia latens]
MSIARFLRRAASFSPDELAEDPQINEAMTNARTPVAGLSVVLFI